MRSRAFKEVSGGVPGEFQRISEALREVPGTVSERGTWRFQGCLRKSQEVLGEHLMSQGYFKGVTVGLRRLQGISRDSRDFQESFTGSHWRFRGSHEGSMEIQ